MNTLVFAIPDGAQVIYDGERRKLLVGVEFDTAAHPFANQVSVFACPGTPDEDQDAVSGYTLTLKRNGKLDVDNIL